MSTPSRRPAGGNPHSLTNDNLHLCMIGEKVSEQSCVPPLGLLPIVRQGGQLFVFAYFPSTKYDTTSEITRFRVVQADFSSLQTSDPFKKHVNIFASPNHQTIEHLAKKGGRAEHDGNEGRSVMFMERDGDSVPLREPCEFYGVGGVIEVGLKITSEHALPRRKDIVQLCVQAFRSLGVHYHPILFIKSPNQSGTKSSISVGQHKVMLASYAPNSHRAIRNCVQSENQLKMLSAWLKSMTLEHFKEFVKQTFGDKLKLVEDSRRFYLSQVCGQKESTTASVEGSASVSVFGERSDQSDVSEGPNQESFETGSRPGTPAWRSHAAACKKGKYMVDFEPAMRRIANQSQRHQIEVARVQQMFEAEMIDRQKRYEALLKKVNDLKETLHAMRDTLTHMPSKNDIECVFFEILTGKNKP